MNEFRAKVHKGIENPSKGFNCVLSRINAGRYGLLRAITGRRFKCGGNLSVRNKLIIHGPGKVLLGDNILIEGGPFKIITFYTYTR